jgi:TonB family protein
MMRKIQPIILIFMICGFSFGQEDLKKLITDCRGGGVITGKAINLPKPTFPLGGEYKPFVSTIIVSVTINENGNVIEANAISGNALFRQTSELAAHSSKFSPSIWGCERKTAYSEITYIFDSIKEDVSISNSNLRFTKELDGNTKQIICSDCYPTNERAAKLEKPDYPSIAKAVQASGTVSVQILIDENGNVIEAKAVSGHPFLRPASIKAALRSKFEPPRISGQLVRVWFFLSYNFVDNSSNIKNQKENKIQTNASYQTRFDHIQLKSKSIKLGIINKKAINLPKPLIRNVNYPSRLKMKQAEIIKVEIILNEQGNVVNAKAISGHRFLHSVCEMAALKAKFYPTNDVGRIRIKAYLVFKIYANGKVKTKF